MDPDNSNLVNLFDETIKLPPLTKNIDGFEIYCKPLEIRQEYVTTANDDLGMPYTRGYLLVLDKKYMEDMNYQIADMGDRITIFYGWKGYDA